MKTKVYNLIILDESGSMAAIEKAAVAGVNETIQTVRAAQADHEDQEHFLSFVSFNDRHHNNIIHTLYDCAPIDNVRDLLPADYNPDCCTPLYDAMGLALGRLGEKVGEKDRVLVTIVTDGYENASVEYDNQKIKKLVERLKEEGWVFAYIGANQDVEQVASSLSIENSLAFEADEESTRKMWKREKQSRKVFYNKLDLPSFSAAEANKDFFKKK